VITPLDLYRAGNSGGLRMDRVRVGRDADHWFWQPAKDMELVEYIRLLAALNPEFSRV
jgi:hypothetical protein